MTLQPGTLLKSRYRIDEVIAQGGMGAVYRAYDTTLNLKVALKENSFSGEEHARQFRREATILADLRHPNLPRVTDHFSIPGQGQYLVMDYVEGEDLRQLLNRKGKLTEAEVVEIGLGVCQGLAYLHSRRPPIVHRDIKPGNVKVTADGGVRLVDFGLAKVAAAGQNTTTGAQALTPGYAPPEQYGQGTEPRSDIYALGATLYAALSGKVPEDGLARAMGSAGLTPLRSLRPDITPATAAAIEKAMAVLPQDRFQTAGEFQRALALGPSQHEPEAGTAATIPAPEPAGSRPLRIGLALGGLAVLAAVGVIFSFVILPGMAALPAATSTPVAEQAAALPPTRTSAPPPQPGLSPQPSATSPTATPTGGAGEIAFASDRSGLPQIWAMQPDGSGLRLITRLPEGACQPDWSPDRNRIIFISPCPAQQDAYEGASLFVINADGSGLVPLPTLPGGDFDPAWSPDGGRVAFTSLRDGRAGVYLMDLATNEVKRLSRPVNYERSPAWSPGGETIAYVTTRGGFPQVWVMGIGGENPHEFSTQEGGRSAAPAWSPDGSLLLYTQGGGPAFLTARQAGTPDAREFRIANDFHPAGGPALSPDGLWAAAASRVDEQEEIFLLRLDGSRLTRLTDHPANDFDPDWR